MTDPAEPTTTHPAPLAVGPCAPRRVRWWRRIGSVRGLMGLVLVVGLGVGWIIRLERVRRQAVLTIEAADGGLVYPDTGIGATLYRRTGLQLGREVEMVQLLGAWEQGDPRTRPRRPRPSRAEVFAALGQLGGVPQIELDTTMITPAEWSVLAATQPETLNINREVGGIDAGALAGLPMLGSLRVLGLTSPALPLPTTALDAAAQLDRLEELTILGLQPGARWVPTRSLPGRWHHLRRLDLDQSPAEGSFLDAIAGGHGLTTLHLPQTQITDDQLRRLVARQPNLESLTLDATRLTDAGTAALASLTALKHLRLQVPPGAPPRLADATLAAVARCPRLTSLALGGRFTGAGIAALTRSPVGYLELDEVGAVDAATWTRVLAATRRRGLAIRGPGVDDRFLAAVASPTSGVVYLALAPSTLTDAATVALGASPVAVLHLSGTPLTDAGLATLGPSTKLRHLNVAGTRVTSAGVAAFRLAHPQVKVTTDREEPPW